MSDIVRDGPQPAGDGGFDPWKVYETLAAILNRREGVEVRLTGLTFISTHTPHAGGATGETEREEDRGEE